MGIAKVITGILVALLIAGLVGGIVLFINNGQSNFYVEYGGERISTEYSNVQLEKGGYTVFGIKNIFGDVVNGMSAKDYTVTVTLCTKNVPDVEFTVGDEEHSLHEKIDFTPAFTITKTDGAFTVFVPQGLTLTEILQACYPDQQVTISNSDVSLWANDCFVLNVKSIAENKTITISVH